MCRPNVCDVSIVTCGGTVDGVGEGFDFNPFSVGGDVYRGISIIVRCQHPGIRTENIVE